MLGADVAADLETAGLGTQGVSIWVGPIPDAAEVTLPAIGLIEDGGGQPSYVLGQAQPEIERPSLMVMVRGADARSTLTAYPDARLLAERVKQRINTYGQSSLSGYLTFMATSDISFMGYDAEQRPEFQVVFQVMKDAEVLP